MRINIRFLFVAFFGFFQLGLAGQDYGTSHSFDQDLSRGIDSIIGYAMEAYMIPGLSLGICKGGEILHLAGYGLKDIEAESPVEATSVFHTASISKLFTAIGLMKLVENGDFAKEARLIDIISGLKSKDEMLSQVTMESLLTHSSGIRDVRNYNWKKKRFSPHPLRDYILSKKLRFDFDPMSETKYSNLAYDVLGVVIEEVSGQSFAAFMSKSILGPYEMTHSSYDYNDIGTALRVAPHSRKLISGKVYRRKTYPYNPEHSPSSTLNSSAYDLTIWMNRFMGEDNPVLSSKTKALMFSLDENLSSYYGLGFQRYTINSTNYVGHYGGDIGFRSFLVLEPLSKTGVVLLANCDYKEEFREDIVLAILGLLDN